ncbi:hypothetical protein B0H12DRAFT_534582 [Mycena haematopus]|nr:hypothetical protein B0H12DRAFT_534582 [Mycena haematopus]
MDPAEDPPIRARHICSECQSRMGPLRVHEGTTKPHCRGKIIQTCVSCYKSHYHTEAYIYTDAVNLLARFHARQLGHAIPPEAANAPLRFRPEVEQDASTGPVQCGAVGCVTKAGARRQAAQKCVEKLCKNCCVQAGADAVQQQMYRDSCRVHQVVAVVGRVPDVRAPAAGAHAPAPGAHAPAPDARAPAPQAAAPAPLVQPTAVNPPPPQGQAGRGRGIPVARGGGPAARARPLAQPMALPWVNQREVVLREKGVDPKAERQRLDKLEQQSCDFIVYHTSGRAPTNLGHPVPTYPKMQLSSTALLQGLGMTENSWFDIYNYVESSWKTLQATAVFLVDKTRPTIIRIRPSLLAELTLDECPNINDLLTPQPRAIKRKLDDLVSPLKKLPRTTTVADTTEAKTVIIIDSPPSSPTLHPSTSGDVSTSSAASTSTAAVTSNTQQAKIWPGGYYVYEHEAAWIKYKHLKDEYGRNKVSIHGTWDQLFPGSKFVHTTVTLWRKFWSTAPQHLKDHCVGEGRKHSGSWQHFVDTVRAHNDGRPFELPVVKTEPTSTSTHLKSIPLPDPPAMLASATEVPPEMGVSDPRACELCVFCNAEITVRPSAKLDQILAHILPSTRLEPTSRNPNRRTADSPRVYAAYCKQHETDSHLLPVARESGWPEQIDYSGLRGRVEQEALPTLQDLLDDVKDCNFFLDALAGTFQKATGYFGELGYYVIFNAVADKFPAITILSDYSPLTWQTLIEQVLVPEAIVALILEDLQVDYDVAIQILKASSDFGLSYHSDPHDRQRSLIIVPDLPPPEPLRLPAPTPFETSSSLPLPVPESSPAEPPAPTPFETSFLLPLPSPLGSPILSPPTLGPVDWELDAHDDPELQPVDPRLLCNYCDQLLPPVQSSKLSALGDKLFAISWPEPSPENANHRRTNGITRTAEYCERHHFENVHLPMAMAAGWPLHPNYEGLFRRILQLKQPLRLLCDDITQSTFFLAARKHYKGKTTQLQSIQAQYGSMNRLAQHGVG